MGKSWFPVWDGENHVHVPVENILFLKADGNYTDIHYFNANGTEVNKKLSGCLSKHEEKLPKRFKRIRRDVIVNRHQVVKHALRKVILSCGKCFTVPKKAWKKVKEMFSPQLRIRFPKKGRGAK